MKSPLSLLRRWLKFNAVGAMGIVVQLAVLSALAGVLRLDYLLATVFAVEAAILHNFIWHERWTWNDRRCGRPAAARLLRFNLTTGTVSIVFNVALMRFFVGCLGLHFLPANILAIAACSLANFLAANLLVWSIHGRQVQSRIPPHG